MALLGAALLMAGCSGEEPPTAVQAPNFTLPDLQQKSRSLKEWRGQVLLVNFWAPWCPPCRREIPDFIQLQKRYRDLGFSVLGIALDSAQNTQAFADSVGINYPLLVGEEQGVTLGAQLGNDIGTLPYTVLLDRSGAVVDRHRGLLSYDEAERKILDLL